jgi:hypothetical protein
MGIDGTNTLTIRGPDEVLKKLEESSLLFEIEEGHPEWFQTLQDEYFGDHLSTVCHENRYIVFKYAFRNKVPKDYLRVILQKNPQIWIKNEYESDAGYCGVWIAHYYQGEISEQYVEWTEPSWEELAFTTDFSQ